MLSAECEVSGFSGFSEFHSCTAAVSESEQAFLMSSNVGPGPIIDVGANLGIVSLLLAFRFPNRPVHAFEPNPSTFQALVGNVHRNGADNVHPHAMAVTDSEEPVLFDARPKARATASLIDSSSEYATEVQSVTLDAFAERRQIQEIAFLKVDVEGYETLVFRGAEKMLAQQRVNLIYYEVCPSMTEKVGFDPILPSMMLQEHGYSLHRLQPGGALQKTDIRTVQDVELDT